MKFQLALIAIFSISQNSARIPAPCPSTFIPVTMPSINKLKTPDPYPNQQNSATMKPKQEKGSPLPTKAPYATKIPMYKLEVEMEKYSITPFPSDPCLSPLPTPYDTKIPVPSRSKPRHEVGTYTPTPMPTVPSPAPSAVSPIPSTHCTYISVEGDATYCIPGAICSGSGEIPTGKKCPRKQNIAVADCHHGVPSYLRNGKCVLSENAHCMKITSTGAWGCVVSTSPSMPKKINVIQNTSDEKTVSTRSGSGIGNSTTTIAVAIAGIVVLVCAIIGFIIIKKRKDRRQAFDNLRSTPNGGNSTSFVL